MAVPPRFQQPPDVTVTHRAYNLERGPATAGSRPCASALRAPAGRPDAQGLYDPHTEHDSCGVGFVADVKGRRSHAIVQKALQVMLNLQHRGACGCEPNTGDGAGILMQVPDRFLRKVCSPFGIQLPTEGEYGVGSVFLPHDAEERERIQQLFEQTVHAEGQRMLGWRDVPVDDSLLGDSAVSMEPLFTQVLIGRGEGIEDQAHFERKLYVIRKLVERAVAKLPDKASASFYVASLSSRTLVYKGMLSANQIQPMFPDLGDPDMETALALIHQRFSTNTFPSWPLAHPYRYITHNGEINTLRGNVNWMRAREALCRSEAMEEDLEKVFPVIREGDSDSATFDSVLEFLVMNGRSLPHAVLMMIPEPWNNHESMKPEVRAFYEYHASLMEAWDGPASIAFTDGTVIGAVLDRNGLRPSRYYVTKDDLVVMASEVGVLDIAPDNVLHKGRLQPGRMFLIDTAQGRIIEDEEIKGTLASEHPYAHWLAEDLVRLENLPDVPAPDASHQTVLTHQLAFGYTHEELRIILCPMAQNGAEPIGSMGTDAALAVLSDRPRMLYDYFKQLFAQVTNPPLDAIREELVTAMESRIGPERNLLKAEPSSCHQINLKCPVIDNAELAKLRHVACKGFRATTISTLYPVAEGSEGLARAVDRIRAQASEAITKGYNILILSDRAINNVQAAVPSLLATAAVHHHLVRQGTRTRCGLVVESGDAREVHHMCMLIGYGAGAVNPWVAFETLDDMIRQGLLEDIDHDGAVKNYIKALSKGILKVMSKMGISTLQSYCGAQIFEAIGLDAGFVDEYFTWTASRIGGIGMDVIADEVRRRHVQAFPSREPGQPSLEWGGEYQWRRDGEYHLFNPDTVFKLQHATQSNQYKIFKEYTRQVDDQSVHRATLRGLFRLKPTDQPLTTSEVQPVEEILQRFSTGAMSYGSISEEAHEMLAVAMNRVGGKSNTGEGGEDPARYVPDANGDSRRSAVKQVASGRFGVTSEYLTNADELQIKMAQGAKPGEGGQLPGAKVYPWIAKVRHSTPGVGLISPPPHHDIYSIEDLAQLIHDLKNSNPSARVSVKLVAEVGVGTVAAGVAKAHADVVLISGYDGGTGASPVTSLKHAGLPWELGLAETQQVLVLNKLRDRIVVQVDGQMKTGRDVVIAALLGAEEYGFSTAPLVVMGCVMMRVCQLNTCPVGIATQDPELRRRFTGQPEFVTNFFRFIAEEVREYMARLGFRTIDEMIGRVDKLDFEPALEHWKANGLDYSSILHEPDMPPSVARRRVTDQDHGLDKALDNLLIRRCRVAIEQRRPVEFMLPIRNVNRTVGTMMGHEVTRRWGADGLPDDTVRIHFKGSAGQSFGAFLPRGITFRLEGDSNDYWGKGLSGGKLVLFPPLESTFLPETNIIVGNVALYGATSGEAYVRGVAGERFAVRNSGAHAVVEGIGDHGCEYMTGGRVVVLGRTGRNFAAGMSGGIAYVLDTDGNFRHRCNTEMVDLEPLLPQDITLLRVLVERHVEHTRSDYAARLLEEWTTVLPTFLKVMPRDYRRVLAATSQAQAQGREPTFKELVGTNGG